MQGKDNVVPIRKNFKSPERAHAAPVNDQSEELARFKVMEVLSNHQKINKEVLDRRAKGQSWMVILGWLLSISGICDLFLFL